jgi:hypothetical protein
MKTIIRFKMYFNKILVEKKDIDGKINDLVFKFYIFLKIVFCILKK